MAFTYVFVYGIMKWNDARFVLEGGPDGASCRRTSANADLALSVADLGALYLGGNSFTALAWIT